MSEFDAVYEKSWWPMYRLAIGLVDSPAIAEDVVQDAFVALYRHWDSMRDATAAPAYLRVSVVNTARSTLRRRRTVRRHLASVHPVDEPAADDRAMLSAEHEQLRRAFARLPQRQREVLTLRYIAELRDTDIAAAVGLSEPGVRSAASRGLAALRTTLGAAL